jgi:pilus assembly protein Flp/PilA
MQGRSFVPDSFNPILKPGPDHRSCREWLMEILRAFLRDRRGATAIEYCMIAACISILCVIGALSIGHTLSAKFLGPLAAGFN